MLIRNDYIDDIEVEVHQYATTQKYYMLEAVGDRRSRRFFHHATEDFRWPYRDLEDIMFPTLADLEECLKRHQAPAKKHKRLHVPMF